MIMGKKCLRLTRRAWILAGVLLCVAPIASASGPAEHAPIGVMGDHTHEKGEVMLSYRYMRMGMKGLRDNAERISRSRVLTEFAVTPTRMEMEMHMLGAMYAPVDGLTLMLMVPLVSMGMDHLTGMGVTFSTKSKGLGDIRVAGLVDLWESGHHKIHANVGLSLPSGSISENDSTPAMGGAKVRLPYPMQIGSGSVDFLPGLTYNGHEEALSWGAQVRGEVRLNENHADYRLGNEYAMTGWGSYTLTDWVSLSLRAEWQQQLNHRGQDPSLAGASAAAIVPTVDKGRRAFMRLDVLAGVNFIVPSGAADGIRIALEAGLPAYQRLDGPGLETDWIVTAGIQYAFDVH